MPLKAPSLTKSRTKKEEFQIELFLLNKRKGNRGQIPNSACQYLNHCSVNLVANMEREPLCAFGF